MVASHRTASWSSASPRSPRVPREIQLTQRSTISPAHDALEVSRARPRSPRSASRAPTPGTPRCASRASGCARPGNRATGESPVRSRFGGSRSPGARGETTAASQQAGRQRVQQRKADAIRSVRYRRDQRESHGSRRCRPEGRRGSALSTGRPDLKALPGKQGEQEGSVVVGVVQRVENARSKGIRSASRASTSSGRNRPRRRQNSKRKAMATNHDERTADFAQARGSRSGVCTFDPPTPPTDDLFPGPTIPATRRCAGRRSRVTRADRLRSTKPVRVRQRQRRQ